MQWGDFNETCHKYSSREWELLKSFSRSEVKGQGHVYRCVRAIHTFWQRGVETCLFAFHAQRQISNWIIVAEAAEIHVYAVIFFWTKILTSALVISHYFDWRGDRDSLPARTSSTAHDKCCFQLFRASVSGTCLRDHLFNLCKPDKQICGNSSRNNIDVFYFTHCDAVGAERVIFCAPTYSNFNINFQKMFRMQCSDPSTEEGHSALPRYNPNVNSHPFCHLCLWSRS